MQKLVNDKLIEMEQSEIDEFNASRTPLLGIAISDKLIELKAERLKRIQIIMPAIESDAVLEMISELWKSINGAARLPTNEWQSMIDVWGAAKSAGVVVKAMTVLNTVESYDVVTDPIWP